MHTKHRELHCSAVLPTTSAPVPVTPYSFCGISLQYCHGSWERLKTSRREASSQKSHKESSHSSVLAMERIFTYFWYFLLRSISTFCFLMFLDTLSKICVVDQLAKQRWHFWSYIKLLLWKKTTSQLLQFTAFLKSGCDHTFLGMPEATREHTRKTIQETTEYFTVPQTLVRGFNFLKGKGQNVYTMWIILLRCWKA